MFLKIKKIFSTCFLYYQFEL